MSACLDAAEVRHSRAHRVDSCFPSLAATRPAHIPSVNESLKRVYSSVLGLTSRLISYTIDLKTQLGAVGGDCAACHKAFRIKKG